MGVFIEVRIDREACLAKQGCEICSRVCPVAAFVIGNGQLMLVHDNEDECTLCNLCVEQCPANAIEVARLY